MAAGGGGGGRKFEVVVWGATGFVGRLTTRYLAEHGPAGLQWAVAGRTRSKLESLVAEVAKEVPAARLPEVVVARVDDEASVDAMVGSTTVVCALAGPYDRVGEAVVKSCAHHGTHYVDITGEVSTFVRRCKRKYADAARASGAVIVHSCGFDSIPSDLGTLALVDHVRRTYKTGVHRVRAFFRLNAKPSGGTLASMFGILEQMGNPEVAADIGDVCVLNDAPEGVVVADGDGVGMDEASPYFEGRYAVPFIMARANTRVVRWSAELLAARGLRYSPATSPFSYKEMSTTRSYRSALIAALSAPIEPVSMCCLTTFPWLLDLAKPWVTQPGDGPDEETRAKSWFETTLVASIDTDSNPDAPPTVTAVMRGGDPGYGETSKMVAEAALTLAKNTTDLHPDTRAGGIFSPAAALGQTLLKRLQDAGIHFEVLE